MSLFFYLFTIVINLWHQKFVTANITAVFVKINMVFSNEDKILIKSFYLKRYTTKRLIDEFSEKAGQSMVYKLFKKLRDTGTVDIATKRNHTTAGSFQRHPHFTKANNYAFECLIFYIFC